MTWNDSIVWVFRDFGLHDCRFKDYYVALLLQFPSTHTPIYFVIQSIDYPIHRQTIQIIKATHMGFCFGVRDAIHLAQEESSKGPVTILGDLVHNRSVMASLEARGITIARTPEAVETPRLMVTAHGTSDRTRQVLENLGFNPIDATCPLVHHAHRSLRRLVSMGYHPVVIGKRGHTEVLGLAGDFDQCEVVLSPEDIRAMKPRARFGVIAQTTQPLERVRGLVDTIRTTFPDAEVRFEDTVCQPTKLRQNSVRELARQCDVVIVVGGKHSNNTAELARTARDHITRVHQVESPEELRDEWVQGCSKIGVTAGTSTPEETIQAVVDRLEELAARAVGE